MAEYWIINPVAETVEQYLWREGGVYAETAPTLKDGEITSEAVAGFTISVRAVFDEEENWRALNRLLAPPL